MLGSSYSSSSLFRISYSPSLFFLGSQTFSSISFSRTLLIFRTQFSYIIMYINCVLKRNRGKRREKSVEKKQIRVWVCVGPCTIWASHDKNPREAFIFRARLSRRTSESHVAGVSVATSGYKSTRRILVYARVFISISYVHISLSVKIRATESYSTYCRSRVTHLFAAAYQ